MLLFLAGKMGLVPCMAAGVIDVERKKPKKHDPGYYEVEIWSPHADKAQFAEVVLWWTQPGRSLMFCGDCVQAWRYYQDHGECERVNHDNTDAGIMAATVTAVARALGWEE